MSEKTTEPLFVIMKRGLYYRPNRRGYTGLLKESGHFSLEETSEIFFNPDSDPEEEGLCFILLSEAPEFAPGCVADIKLRCLQDEVDALRKQLEEADAWTQHENQVKNRYSYFVSYVHTKGFGHTSVHTLGPWDQRTADIAATGIAKGFGFTQVAILHYTLMQVAQPASVGKSLN